MTQSAEALTAGLEVLEPIKPMTVTTRVGSFDISTIKMKSFRQFAMLAWPMVEDVMGLVDGKGDVARVIGEHFPALVELICLTSTMTPSDCDEMHPDDFLSMVLAVVEVNMDFFVQNLIPMLGSRAGFIKDKLEATLGKAGLTVSSASEAMATQSKKSKTVH